jgi:hypothetical protein
MVEVYIILGDSGVRKSATIRALTGVRQVEKQYKISTSTGTNDFYVEVRALQENTITAAKFIKDVHMSGRQHVLTALRINAAKTLPNGTRYIQDFINAGWTIRHIVALGPTPIPAMPAGAPALPTPITNSTSLAANEIASMIRNWWGWK